MPISYRTGIIVVFQYMYKLRYYRLMQIITRKCNSTTDNIIRMTIYTPVSIYSGSSNSAHCYMYNIEHVFEFHILAVMNT